MILLILACAAGSGIDTAGADGDAVDGGAVDGGADSGSDIASACAQTVEHSGAVVGTRSCSDGVCEVPAGPFVMGAADPLSPDQCPQRLVTLSAFAIDETELTRGAWQACVDAGACSPLPACDSEAAWTVEEELPATCMDWQQATELCAWRGGRLPTEAEWEKAARGEDGALWAWGAEAPSCSTTNFRYVNSYCRGGVVEVGSYAVVDDFLSSVEEGRSAYGLLDTAGNAWEWVADWYDAGWYSDAPDTDPGSPEQCRLDPDDEPGECRYRVIRGGAYNSSQTSVLGSARSFAEPGVWDVNVGVRCAYSR